VSLALDFSSSREKLKRAIELADTINGELPIYLRERHPYSLVLDFNEQDGWLTVWLKPESTDLRFAVLLGELVHDLRSALDHAVSVLVAANRQVLRKSHQFPIHTNRRAFHDAVGTSRSPRGWLLGVKVGFREIKRCQPFHLKPDPSQAALAALNRLSNSDKHRSPVFLAPYPNSSQIRVTHNGCIVDHWEPPGPIVWEPDGQAKILALRFARPYPTEREVKADLNLNVTFRDDAFPPEHPNAVVFTADDLYQMCREVSFFLDAVEAL
jgi:hypothetical protein